MKSNFHSSISNSQSSNDIVITGLGCVTPAGEGVRPFWEACLNKQSCLEPYTTDYYEGYAGICDDGSPSLPNNRDSRLNGFITHAVTEALHDAYLDSKEKSIRIGYCISTSKPNLNVKQSLFSGAQRAFPVASCVSGLASLLLAKNMLLDGQCDAVVCGAADSALDPFLVAAYKKMGVLITKKDSIEAFCPYDKHRSGFFPGEGCGVCVVEKREHAQTRNIAPYAKISKILIHSEAFHETHINSEGDGIALLLRQLTVNGQIKTPDYINLHGTATQDNDLAEARAIRTVFGAQNKTVDVSASKPYTGHMVSASSSVEIISCLLSIKYGLIPPVLHLKNQDQECPMQIVTDLKKKEIASAVSLSYGFGSVLGGVLLEKDGYKDFCHDREMDTV